MHSDPLYWLKNLVIMAREDDNEGEEDQGDAGDNGDDNSEESESQEDSSSDSDSSDDEDEGDEEDTAKLKAALKKERLLRRKAERDARRARKGTPKQDEDQSDSDEGESKEDARLRRKLDASEQRSRKLAEGFRKKSIDDAILTEARKQGFIDPTDALTDDIRGEVDYEQDKDDPTQVDIDTESVEDAVKDLADRKKHLVGKGSPGTPSGGKFRRKQGSNDDEPTNDKVLKSRYASLN